MDNARRPLIGVTGHHTESSSGVPMVTAKQAYLDAVEMAGGIPVILTPTADAGLIGDLLSRVDGVVLTGGKDIDPRHYGEPVLNETVQLEPDRDAFELPLVREAIGRDLPVLAICRGCQVLNVALGGTLWQDLPAQLPEAQAHSQRAQRTVPTHPVMVEAGSRLAQLLGAWAAQPILTNTFHHQAARRVPDQLRPVAWASDGVIEAVEAPGARFAVGVQWHPEDLAAARPEHRRLFEALVAAARFK
jgi:putative glutamine amidotransferase